MNFDPTGYPAIFYVLTLWSLFWKGIALWRSAKQGQRNWYIALLILNTLGVLELVYLFRFAKKPLTLDEIKKWRVFPQDKK